MISPSASQSPSSSVSPSPVIYELSTDYFDVLASIVYANKYAEQGTNYTDTYVAQDTQYVRKYT